MNLHRSISNSASDNLYFRSRNDYHRVQLVDATSRVDTNTVVASLSVLVVVSISIVVDSRVESAVVPSSILVVVSVVGIPITQTLLGA